MKQEMVKKQETALTVADQDLLKEMEASKGAAADVTAEDIQFPIISLQHPMSKKVLEGIAMPGSIFHYQLEKTIGSKQMPMLFIPIKFYKFWRLEDLKGVMKTQRPWKLGDVVNYDRNDGFREVEMHVYYIFTKDDLENKSTLPSRFSFKRSSLKAARYISTQMDILGRQGIKPWDFYWKMTTVLTKAKDNTYYEPVVVIDNKDPVPVEHKLTTFKWYKTMTAVEYTSKVVEDVMKNAEESVVETHNCNVDNDIVTDF